MSTDRGDTPGDGEDGGDVSIGSELTVGETRILRASQIAKIPSGEGQTFGTARLDRSAEVAAKRGKTVEEILG